MSRDPAVALHQALSDAGVSAFLDTDAIDDGNRFPQALSDALLGARVAVVFAHSAYFQRWYCLRELNLLLAAYNTHARRGSDPVVRDAALDGIVVALPAAGGSGEVERLPPPLATTNWPPADHTDRLVALVAEALEEDSPSFERRLEIAGVDDAGRRLLTDPAQVPPPGSLQAVPLVPADLDPSLGDRFVGRAVELWQLHYRLSTMRGDTAQVAAVTASVEGGGGFGKTRLAREYLWRYADAYPGGCFWVDAAADDALVEQRHYDIARALDPDLPPLKQLRDQQADIRERLADRLHQVPPDRPVLFVVDNVPQPESEQLPRGLDEWCPTLGQTTVLATTRQRTLLVGGVDVVELDTLDIDAAVQLLTTDLTMEGEPRVWADIVQWVGCLPLALEVLNGALRAGAVTVTDLHANTTGVSVTAEIDELADVLRPYVPAGSLRGITEAFRTSYTTLTEAARDAALLLAQLGPEPIPTALIDALGTPPAARVELTARSFIFPARSTGVVEMYGRMHRVIADFIRHQADTSAFVRSEVDVPSVKTLALTAARGLNVAHPSTPKETSSGELAQHLAQHVTTVVRRSNELDITSVDLLNVALQAARYALMQGQVESALNLIDDVLHPTDMDELLQTEPDLAIRIADARGAGLRMAADHNAAARVYEELRASLSKLELELPGQVMVNYASALLGQGQLDDAESFLRRGAKSAAAEGDEWLEADARGNLAIVLRKQDRFAQARVEVERSIAIRTRLVAQGVIAADHFSLSDDIANLGTIQYELGDFGSALASHERALDMHVASVGKMHPSTAMDYGNIGNTLIRLGRRDEAADAYESAAAIFDDLDDYPREAASLRSEAQEVRSRGS